MIQVSSVSKARRQKTGKIGRQRPRSLIFRHLHPPRVLFAPFSFSTVMAVDNEDIHRRRTRELFPVQSTTLLLPSKIPPTAPSCLVRKANQKGIIRLLFNPVVLHDLRFMLYTKCFCFIRNFFSKGRNFTKIVYFCKSLFIRFKKTHIYCAVLIIFLRLIIIFNASFVTRNS